MSQELEYLFVGGPADGEWRKVVQGVNSTTAYTPKTTGKPPLSSDAMVATGTTMFRRTIYYRVELCGACDSAGDRVDRFYVFAKAGMTGSQIMSALIEGYKPYMARERVKEVRPTQA